jgi:linoleoyl-CoA desaturase
MKYSKSNNNKFFNGLKPVVENYFASKNIDKKGNWALAFKGVILLSIYILSYFSIFRLNATIDKIIEAYIIMGLSGVMIVFNLVHDASHKAVSNNNLINKFVCFLGDLVGINTHIWDIRHNIQHHTFTNVLGGDLIIESIPLIRLSPQQPYKNFHKYQLYYSPILYMFYSFYWMFVIDFKLFFKKDICNLHNINHAPKDWFVLVTTKLFYVFYMIVLPCMFTPYSLLTVIICFLFMHMAAGLLLSFVAVMGHFVEGPIFPDAPNGIIENSWSEHELEATIDFAPKSQVVNWITGGLNTHVAHHLFPSICHIHYYGLTKIIENYCAENNYQYKKESLWGGLKSHFRYLKKLARP